MSVASGDSVILTKALKDLLMYWDIAGRGWSDEARKGFSKEFIEEIERALRTASLAASEIEDLLHQARQQCA